MNLATTAVTLRTRSRLDITAASDLLLCRRTHTLLFSLRMELAYSHSRRPAPWDKNQARADAYAHVRAERLRSTDPAQLRSAAHFEARQAQRFVSRVRGVRLEPEQLGGA